ncbi:MAG: response regulator [Phycisphaerales bacterium]|nr:MAG: response regulator [Phycisphaerales bacterium]
MSKKAAPAKILVVDDERDCLSIIQCRLEWGKYKVITADNGAEGLRIAEDEKPDVVLLDYNMPVMNGLEMLERMRKNPALRDTPVIMVTALCESQDIAAASAYGVADYVTKPVDFTSLLEKISNLLENKPAKCIKK